jgi:hypothetical protein
MPSLPAHHASSASQPVPPKPHRRPVALFPPDSDKDEYDLPGLVTTKRSVEKAPAAPSKGSDDEEDTVQMDNEEDTAQKDDEDTAQTDDEDTAQTDNEEDTAQTDNEEDTVQTDNEEDTAKTDNEDTAQTDNEEDTAQTDNEDDDNDEEVTKKASSSKGRAGATNLTPTPWAVIVSMD